MVDWTELLSNPTGNFSDLERINTLLQEDGIMKIDLDSLRLEHLRNLFLMIDGYIKRRKDNNAKQKIAHRDQMNDLKRDLTKERDELMHSIGQITEEKSSLANLCSKYLKEVCHSNTPTHAKLRLINEGRDFLTDDTSERFRELSKESLTISRFSSFPAFSGPQNQSLLPYHRTEGNLLTTYTKLGNVWQIWDKNMTTGDTSRVVFSEQSVSAVLCDGAGSTGVPGMLFSRILATLIAEVIPMSLHSVDIFAANPMKEILGRSLLFKSSNEKGYSPLYRSISSQDAGSLPTTLHNGMSTALNVIVHQDGLFWYSSVGDCHLYVIRPQEEQAPSVIPIFTTTNEADDTDLIGFQHQPQITRSTDDVGRTCFLNKGDILVMLSDHIASYASGFDEEFFSAVIQICENENGYDKSMNLIDKLIRNVIDNSDTSDDISAIFFKFEHQVQKPPSKPISWGSEGQFYTHEGRKYEVFEKNYYHDGKSSGIKRINRYVASNLFLVLQKYQKLPDFVPEFEIFQSTSDDSCFIMIKHLDQGEYIRLDRVIYGLSSIEEVEQIQRLLRNLRKSMTESRLVHCDIAPTNVFVSKSFEEIKIVDLDTLYCIGCFPLDIETGHQGMFGAEMRGYVPSLYVHKFPLLVLDFTLEIIKSFEGNIEDFVKQHIDKNSDEEYLLSPNLLDAVFRDNLGTREDELLSEIKLAYPFTRDDAIRNFLYEARQNQIFSI